MQEFYFALLGDEVKLPLYVTGVGATDPERHCTRPTGHVYHQVIYTARGEGVLIIDGEEYKIPKCTGFFPSCILSPRIQGKGRRQLGNPLGVILRGFC